MSAPDELLPCPFCAGAAAIERDDGLVYVGCQRCFIQSGSCIDNETGLRIVRNRWNSRAAPTAPQGAEIARENALRELVLTVGNYMQAKLYGRVADVEFNYMRQALSQARAALTPTDAEMKC